MTHQLTPLLKWAEERASSATKNTDAHRGDTTIDGMERFHYYEGESGAMDDVVEKIKAAIIEDVTTDRGVTMGDHRAEMFTAFDRDL